MPDSRPTAGEQRTAVPRRERLRVVADHLRTLDGHTEARGVRLAIEAFHPDGPDVSYPAAARRKQVPADAEVGRRGLAFPQSLFAQ